MIIPQLWAEALVKERKGKRQLTVRRFGWSDQSQKDAARNTDERARSAFDLIAAGEKLPKRERKVRQQWITECEARAEHHASCRFVAALAAPTDDPKAPEVQTLHDALRRANSSLPLARSP